MGDKQQKKEDELARQRREIAKVLIKTTEFLSTLKKIKNELGNVKPAAEDVKANNLIRKNSKILQVGENYAGYAGDGVRLKLNLGDDVNADIVIAPEDSVKAAEKCLQQLINDIRKIEAALEAKDFATVKGMRRIETLIEHAQHDLKTNLNHVLETAAGTTKFTTWFATIGTAASRFLTDLAAVVKNIHLFHISEIMQPETNNLKGFNTIFRDLTKRLEIDASELSNAISKNRIDNNSASISANNQQNQENQDVVDKQNPDPNIVKSKNST